MSDTIQTSFFIYPQHEYIHGSNLGDLKIKEGYKQTSTILTGKFNDVKKKEGGMVRALLDREGEDKVFREELIMSSTVN